MDERVANELMKARQALKKKLESLRYDIANAKRDIDIHYAPIAEPLKEIAMKLDEKLPRKRLKKSLGSSSDAGMEESFSFSLPEKVHDPIPGTSISRHVSTPRKQKHVSWFSPGVHSSPTKIASSKSAASSASFPQPSFLEDDYIGEYLPETPTIAQDISTPQEGDDVEDTSGSIDLEKSMAHALSLLQTKPSKSIINDKSLNKTLLDTDIVRESLKNHHPTVRPYLMGLMTDDKEEFDEKYGVRESEQALKMGNALVGFEDENIVIGKFKYKGTKGLYELLFKKVPGKFTFADAKNYKFILRDTNAHKVNYDPDKKIAASRAFKYVKIIKPILDGKPPNVWWTRNWKTGLGLGTKKVFHPIKKLSKELIPNSIIEYKYWDDVNELCDRLKLLIASKEAGHTGHDNEIIAIIEELKEAEIIQ